MKLKVGILGATGAAGIEFVRALYNHPWFEIEELYASDKNQGKTLEEACKLDLSGLPQNVKNKSLGSLEIVNHDLDLFCSALPSELAKTIEEKCAKYTPVISTTSAFRYESDVPIMITEVNSKHYKLLQRQKQRGWKGWIAPGPNCTTVGLVMALHPIYKEFGIERVIMSSYQSVSGGGASLIQKWREQRFGALPEISEVEKPLINPALMVADNVLGHIHLEEQKVKKETLKILGNYYSGKKILEDAEFSIDCSCVRVPTYKGHFETVIVQTMKNCSADNLKGLYAMFDDCCRSSFGHLPSSPKETLVVLDRSPEPYYDVNLYGGMATVIGRIEKSNAFSNGLKFQVLSNNTVKGAAKGMIQVAEYLHSIGFLMPK